MWTEGENLRVDFEDIEIQTFATLHKWVSDKATNQAEARIYHWIFAKKEEREVNHVLQVVIAADYLGLGHFREFEDYMNQCLRSRCSTTAGL